MELCDTDLKQIALKLAKTVEKLELIVTGHESKISTLTNEITDLKEKVSSQERYSRKRLFNFAQILVDATF